MPQNILPMFSSRSFTVSCLIFRGFQAAQTVNNLPTMQETQVQSLGWEDPLEKEKATHSSSLAWGIPWTQPLTHSEFLFIYGVRECFNFIDIHVAAQLSKQHSLQK